MGSQIKLFQFSFSSVLIILGLFLGVTAFINYFSNNFTFNLANILSFSLGILITGYALHRLKMIEDKEFHLK